LEQQVKELINMELTDDVLMNTIKDLLK
jgi:hypothetical protein